MASLIKTVSSQHTRLLMQVFLLLLTCLVFSYSLLKTNWIAASVISFALLFFFTINIIRIVEKTNQDFAQFINNISHDDFTTFSGASNQTFTGQAFVEAQKTLLSKFRKLKADRTAQTEFLQMVVDHVDAALLCFDENGKVEFSNHVTENLLGKKYIPSLTTIATINNSLADNLKDIQPGESRVRKLVLNGELNQLILSATEFVLQERWLKLVSLKNIKGALDEREIESWQKLIKVLTHEIMNSMTPIVSLSRYVDSKVSDSQALAQLQDPNSEHSKDLHQSLVAIMSRSEGLMKFVDNYRSLSNLPKPQFNQFQVGNLFNRIELMIAEEAKDCRISFSCEVIPISLELSADESLLEQVLINLISNAFSAVENKSDRTVSLKAWEENEGNLIIRISDNGCGIKKEIIDDIFTPFYTTKPDGSGIGLSLSRQLARLNRGMLSVSSIEGKGTQFTLRF